MEENREEFWDRIEDIRTGMLEIGARFTPMTHSTDPEDGNLWFLTAKDTDAAAAASAGEKSRYVVSNDSEGIYADIHGTLSVSHDRAILEEVWSPIASAWFADGINDPDIVLVCFRPASAEVWLGPESGLEGLFALAKAKLTGTTEDMGRQFSLTFA